MSVNQNEIVINYKEIYWTSASLKDVWRLVFVSAKNNQDAIISSMERQFYRMVWRHDGTIGNWQHFHIGNI